MQRSHHWYNDTCFSEVVHNQPFSKSGRIGYYVCFDPWGSSLMNKSYIGKEYTTHYMMFPTRFFWWYEFVFSAPHFFKNFFIQRLFDVDNHTDAYFEGVFSEISNA